MMMMNCGSITVLQEVVEKSSAMLYRVTKLSDCSIWSTGVLNRFELINALLTVIDTHRNEHMVCVCVSVFNLII
jgi:hypothetical protein